MQLGSEFFATAEIQISKSEPAAFVHPDRWQCLRGQHAAVERGQHHFNEEEMAILEKG